MKILEESRPHDLLLEANAFLAMLTGNLSDDGLSLDDSQMRMGFCLTLNEAMGRIEEVARMLRPLPETATE